MSSIKLCYLETKDHVMFEKDIEYDVIFDYTLKVHHVNTVVS